MEQTLEYRIRQRAYEIWHANGQADGQAHEHWLAAEREVLSSLSVSGTPAASMPAKSPKRARAAGRSVGKSSATTGSAPAGRASVEARLKS